MAGSVQRSGKKFYIQIYWNNKAVKLYYDCDTFQPFYQQNRALKYLGIAQQQIDMVEFDPKNWKLGSPVLVENKAANWVENKKVSKKTLIGYRTAVNKYILPILGTKDVRRLKAGHIEDFYNRVKSEVSEETAYKAGSTLRTMLRDLYRREEIFRVPPFPVMSRSSTKKTIEYLTLPQQETLLAAIPERYRPIFEFGMEYGLRTQEARAIQWDCVKNGRVIIKRAFSENELKGTKTEEEREYKQTEYSQIILEAAKQNTSTTFVFVRLDGKPNTNKDLNKIWHEAETATGIKCKLQNAMRHSLACQLLDQGEDIETVRQILGHINIKMTMRYTNRRATPSANLALERRRARVMEISHQKAEEISG